MSISLLKNVFTKVKSMNYVSVQMLRVTNNKNGSLYYSRQIEIHPEENLYEFISSICDKYNRTMDEAESIDDYCGDIVKGRIYKLPVNNEIISDYYQSLLSTVSNPSTEGDVVMKDWNALVLKGNIEMSGGDHQVILISMKSPVSVLTNKYVLYGKDRFKKLNNPVLTLNKNIDAIIVNDTLYMLTMQAENLFNMERSYRIRCEGIIEEVIELDILTNPDSFTSIATKGQNPRRFVTFNQDRLEAIKNTNSRIKYMKMFQISVKDGQIDTDDEKSSERLVKFLCDKAMLDPIDEEPREVSAAKAWS